MNSFIKSALITGYFSTGLMTTAQFGYVCGSSFGENNVDRNKLINVSYCAGLLWPIVGAATSCI